MPHLLYLNPGPDRQILKINKYLWPQIIKCYSPSHESLQALITVNHLWLIILSNSYVCLHHGVIQTLDWDLWVLLKPQVLSREFPGGAEPSGLSLEYTAIGNCLITVYTGILHWGGFLSSSSFHWYWHSPLMDFEGLVTSRSGVKLLEVRIFKKSLGLSFH